jgi:hypothetical protein
VRFSGEPEIHLETKFVTHLCPNLLTESSVRGSLHAMLTLDQIEDLAEPPLPLPRAQPRPAGSVDRPRPKPLEKKPYLIDAVPKPWWQQG